MAPRTASALKSWDYPKKSGIRIREILNTRAGETFGASYLVTVPAEPKAKRDRQRKQFKTKEAAERFADETQNGICTHGDSFFALTKKDREDAIACLPRLRDHGVSLPEIVACLPTLREHGLSLTEAVRFAVKHLRPEGKTKSLAEIVAELNGSKEQRYDRGDLRERSYRDFRHRTERFAAGFTGRIASEITGEEIKAWLLGLGKRSPRTTRNDVAVLGELFQYAVEKRYVAFSPLRDLSKAEWRELCGNPAVTREPGILTPTDAEKLLKAALANPDLDLLAAVTLGLFCGLRTEEIKRLDWASVRLAETPALVTIGAKIAKKRRIRHVEIPANAVQWLSLVSNHEGQVAPNAHYNDFQKRFRKLQKLAGIGTKDANGTWQSSWPSNGMRHSFGTYHYALHGNPLETARLLGHKVSDQVLFDHYRALATKTQADAFFAIRPPAGAAKIVRFA